MKKILKSMILVAVFAIVLTAFTACEAQEVIDKVMNFINPCEHTGGVATCTEAAVCEKCGVAYGYPAGHVTVTDAEVAPTCTETGLTEGYHCEVCDEVFLEQFTVKATGHTWDTTYTCKVCQVKYCVAMGHPWADATCTNPKTCQVCKVTEGEPVPENHVWADATCTEPKTCKECDVTEGEALGHDWYGLPFCTFPDFCQVCDEERGEIEPEGHAYVNGVCYYCKAAMPAADSTVSLTHAFYIGLFMEESEEGANDAYTTGKYYISGVVVNIDNTYFGNMTIADENGNTFYVYGVNDAEGNKYSDMNSKPVVGDTVKLYGVIGNYQGAPQMKEATLVEFTHEHAYADATCTDPKTCACGATDGEANGHTFAEGKCTVCGAADPSVVTFTAVTGTMHVMNKDTAYYVGVISDNGKFYTATTDAKDAVKVTIEFSDDKKLAKIKIGDKYVAPAAGNNNGMRSEEYVWAVTTNEDGSYTFAGQGDDTTTLSFNTSAPRFQGYKNATVSSSKYPCNFVFTPDDTTGN